MAWREIGIHVSICPVTSGTPLHAAAYLGRTEVIKVLLDGGADLYMETGQGWTALVVAALFRQENVIRMLTSRGTDPNKPNNLMPILVNVALQNNTTIQLENYQQLSVYGNNYPTIDGTPMRDYIHVEDLARGHILALQNIDKLHHYNSINLGLGKPISVLELVNTFSRVNKVEIPYLIKNRRDGDIPISYCIAENAQKKLDWYPEKTIEDMCQDSWKFAKMKYSMD